MTTNQEAIFRKLQRCYHRGNGIAKRISDNKLFQITPRKLILFVNNPRLLNEVDVVE